MPGQTAEQVTQNDGNSELVGSVVKPRPTVGVFVGRTAHVRHTHTAIQRHAHTCVIARWLPIKILCKICYCFLNAEVQRMRSEKFSDFMMLIRPPSLMLCTV